MRSRWLAALGGRRTREGVFMGASLRQSSGGRRWRSMADLSWRRASAGSCTGPARHGTCIGWLRMADALDERTISLEGAQRVLTAALALADRMKVRVSVAVAGRAGVLKAEMREEPELFHGMIGIDGIIAFAGGVPIRLDGQLIGAVAVSGGSSEQDEEVAQAAAGAITSGRG